MKKRMLRSLCVGVLLVGLILQNNYICQAFEFPPILSSGNKQEEEVVQLPDYTTEFATILDANRSFYEGYSLDESFLLWFVNRYGSAALSEITLAVTNGEEDSSTWYDVTGKSMHVLWLDYCKSLGYSSYLWSNVHELATSGDTITMDFIGDVNFDVDWSTTKTLEANGGDLSTCITEDVLEELNAADFTMMNNEYTYSTNGEALEGKTYTFRADPDSVKYLEEMGVDLANLANNHVWDYGEEGFLDTLSVLQEAGIDYVGAGKDLEEASAIQYYVMGGRKIAVVSATQIEKTHKYTREASTISPGVLKTLDPSIYLEVIAKAKATSDYVICNVHWGAEAVLFLMQDQKELAQQYVDAGADIVIGNHSHRLQGMSYVDGVPIVHSLGNFWFCNSKLYTTILQVQINTDGELDVRYIPCLMNEDVTSLITDAEETEDFYQYICDLSEGIAIGEDGLVYASEGGVNDAATLDALPYHSGKRYASHTGGQDLDGRKIDIVGDK